MTPACKLLDQQKIAYRKHEYEHDPNNHNFGLEALEKLGLTLEETFKTLLVTDGKIIMSPCFQSPISSISKKHQTLWAVKNWQSQRSKTPNA